MFFERIFQLLGFRFSGEGNIKFYLGHGSSGLELMEVMEVLISFTLITTTLIPISGLLRYRKMSLQLQVHN